MATLPIRELGGVGIVTDTNPYDLPANAFSDGNNVIFDEGRVKRSPVFKQLYSAVKSSKTWADFGADTWSSGASVTYESAEGSSTDNARFVTSVSDPEAGETVVLCDKDGTVRAYPGGTLQVQTPSTGTLVDNEEPWASTQVAGLSILSRGGARPYVKKIATDTNYTYFATAQWATNESCAVMRAYGDFLVALNFTRGSTNFPTMVKWSNPIQYGSAPGDVIWDATDPANTAGENVLGELRNPLIDGLALGTQFILYSQDQVWLMEYTGSSFVFNFRRLFPTGGLINQNCVVEIEGKHFVFGVDDIYIHDGSTKKSIADGRVRREIFKNLDVAKRTRFSVVHDSVSNLIYFNYITLKSEVGFPSTAFCNRAAIYNYRSDTWSFMDLPNVVGSAESEISLTGNNYPQAIQSYESYNSSYVAFEGVTPRMPIMLGITDNARGITESRVYALDLPSIGNLSTPPHPEAFKPAYVAREGLDLDEIKAELRGYKQIRYIAPQAEFPVSTGSLYWQLGATDLPGGQINYVTNYDFNPATEYKIDTKVSGRYLAYKISTDDIEDFQVSGFDADVVVLSKR